MTPKRGDRVERREENLGEIDPTGRLDVACYKLAMAAIEQWENVFGVKIAAMVDYGLQQQIREAIPNEVVDGVSKVVKKFREIQSLKNGEDRVGEKEDR